MTQRQGGGHVVDGRLVRRWLVASADSVRGHRELLDATNVFPVADGDTGTNVSRTLTAVVRALDDEDPTDAGGVLWTAARAAALGARGNSGMLLSLFLTGIAEYVGSTPAGVQPVQPPSAAAEDMVGLLRAGAARMRSGTARPVEGTILSVADAAAGAPPLGEPGQSAHAVVGRAVERARAELLAGPDRLPVLAEAGVVDAGGLAFVLMLEALEASLTAPAAAACADGAHCRHATLVRPGLRGLRPSVDSAPVEPDGEQRYEVMFRADGAGRAPDALVSALDDLGDSVSIVPVGDTGHVVHVHTAEAGEAVEAGMRWGSVSDLRIDTLPADPAAEACDPDGTAAVSGSTAPAAAPTTVVLAFVMGAGCARLFAESGAVPYRLDRRDGLRDVGEILDRHRAERVLVMPNGLLGSTRVGRVAGEVRTRGQQVDLLWSASMVQGLAALSVRDPNRPAAEDLYAMSEAVAGTRWGTVVRSRTRALTSLGMAEAGELLARLGLEVVEFGQDPTLVTCRLVDRFLSSGGEVVTVLSGLSAPVHLGDDLQRHVESTHPGVELTVVDGGQPDEILAIGVE